MPRLLLPYLLACLLALAGMANASTALGAERSAGVEIPGTGLVIEAGLPAVDKAGLPDPRLTKAISGWLAAALGLPAMRQPPAFAIVPPADLISLRLKGFSADPAPPITNAPIGAGNVVALYDRRTRTIYLSEGWDGSTPAQLSVVVHELVHHLQNETGQRAACPEYLEAAAFDAQERWLALFDTDLDREFGLDPFTLLVRTNCPL